MLSASVLSFDNGDNSELEAIFEKCCIPKKEYLDLQEKLTSKLLILSEDDTDSDLENRLFGKK